MTLSTFTLFTPLLVEAYEIDLIAATMNYTTFTAFSVITTIPANYIIDTYGFKKSVLFGSSVMIVGVWVRIFINTNYYFALGGQVIISSAYSFIMNATPAIGAKWFNTSDRTLATTIGSMMTPLAALI